MVLERVQSLLKLRFQVVGAVHNGVDLVAEAKRLGPDVIVSDITMPLLNGIEAAYELRKAGSTAKLVFLTVHGSPAFVDMCLAQGALGYVTKERMGLDLITAINEALQGRRFISPQIRTEQSSQGLI